MSLCTSMISYCEKTEMWCLKTTYGACAYFISEEEALKFLKSLEAPGSYKGSV